MSGGFYDYSQYSILNIKEAIATVISNNDSDDVNEYGDRISYQLTPETIIRFKEAVDCLEKAYIYAQRIDWFLSGDDGEDSFHRRLTDELEQLERAKTPLT